MLHAVRPESNFEREAARLSYARSSSSYAHPQAPLSLEAHQPTLAMPFSPTRTRNTPRVMVAPPSLGSTHCQQPGCTHVAVNARELAHHVRAAHGLAASPPRSVSSRLRQRSPPPPRRSASLNASPSRPSSSTHRGIIHLRSIQPPSTWTPPKPVRLQDVLEDEEMELDVREQDECSFTKENDWRLSEASSRGYSPRSWGTAALAPHNALSPSPTFSLAPAPDLSQIRSVTALEAIPEDEWLE
ncbi:hypothetical protein EV122DRAFT_271310 [Schizophyllum commune]